MLSRKKLIATVVVAVIVIVSCGTGAWYYLLTAQKAELQGIVIEKIEKKSEGLNLTIYAVPRETYFSGDAHVRITHKGTSVYEGTLHIKCTGSTNISYPDFVTENGNYSLRVAFKGKEASKNFKIYGVVTNFTMISVNEELDGEQPKIHVKIFPNVGDPLAPKVMLTITRIGGGGEAEEYIGFTGTVYEDKISYNKSGWYNVSVTVVNPVKEGSAYTKIKGYAVENETIKDKVLINLPPVITVHPQDTTIHYRSNTTGGSEGWACFVSSDVAKGRDNEIKFAAVDYDGEKPHVTWDFGYNQSLGRPAKAEKNETNDSAEGAAEDFEVYYQYPHPQYPQEREYTATLYVYDIHEEKVTAVVTESCKIEVRR